MSKIRRVATPEGEAHFGQPIGSIIVADSKLSHLELMLDSEWPDWDKIKAPDGTIFYIGKDPEVPRQWVITDDQSLEVGTAKTETAAFIELDRYAAAHHNVPVKQPAKAVQAKPKPKPRAQPKKAASAKMVYKNKKRINDKPTVEFDYEGRRYRVEKLRGGILEEWQATDLASGRSLVFKGPGTTTLQVERLPKRLAAIDAAIAKLHDDNKRPGLNSQEDLDWQNRTAAYRHYQHPPHFNRAVSDDLRTADRMHREGRYEERDYWLAQVDRTLALQREREEEWHKRVDDWRAQVEKNKKYWLQGSADYEPSFAVLKRDFDHAVQDNRITAAENLLRRMDELAAKLNRTKVDDVVVETKETRDQQTERELRREVQRSEAIRVTKARQAQAEKAKREAAKASGKKRVVRTPEGARRYGVPIGTAIGSGYKSQGKEHEARDVQAIQGVLVDLGYLDKNSGKNGGVDGKFGPKTEEALKAYQKERGLDPSGAVDAKTAAEIIKDMKSERADRGGEGPGPARGSSGSGTRKKTKKEEREEAEAERKRKFREGRRDKPPVRGDTRRGLRSPDRTDRQKPKQTRKYGDRLGAARVSEAAKRRNRARVARGQQRSKDTTLNIMETKRLIADATALLDED